MEKAFCIYCQAETSLFIGGRPVCLFCSELIDSGKSPRRKELKCDEQHAKDKCEYPSGN
jgi:hypothetical protein